MVPPTPTEIAWTAGIIDGEGCIGIYSDRSKGPDSHRLYLTVANTEERMLVRLKTLWGGDYRLQKRRTSAHHRCVWAWRMHDRAAGRFLEVVLPYLVVKKEQAEIALEFVSLFGRGSTRRTPENKGKRVELAERLKLAKTA